MLALMDWVKRKGIAGTYSTKTQKRTGSRSARLGEDYDVAFAIMLKILKKGINPQPFLLPAYDAEKVNLVKKIKNALNNVKS